MFGLGEVNVQSGTSLDLNGFSVANKLNVTGQGSNALGSLLNSNANKAATYTGEIDLIGNSLFSGLGLINITGLVNSGVNTLLFSKGSFNLSNSNNLIGVIAADRVGNLSLIDKSTLTVDKIGSVFGITSSKGLKLVSNAGNIIINQNISNTGQDISITSASELTIAANAFVNNSGGNIYAQTPHFVNNNSSAVTLSATQAGSYFQVWSTNSDPFNLDPTLGDVRGGLVYNYKQYNSQFGSAQVLGKGNGLLYSFAPTLTASLVDVVTKTYDGNTGATLSPSNYSYSNNVDADTVVLNYPVLGNYMTQGTGQGVTDVGSAKVVQVNGVQIVSSANLGGVSVYGYKIANTTISSPIGVVTTKTVTVLGDQNVNKPVDGLTTMPVGTLGWTVDKSQFISGDDAKITGLAAYDTSMVGIRKLLVGSVAIVGYNAVDYSLNFVIGKGMIVPSQPILEPSAASLAVQPGFTSLVSVAVIKPATEVSSGIVQAEVPLTQTKGFSFKLPENLKDAVAINSNDATAKQINDSPLPYWLTFDAKTTSFVAQNVPDNGLPIKVQLITGGQKFVVEIFKADQVIAQGQSGATGLPRAVKPATLEKSQLTLVSANAVGQLKPSQMSELGMLQIQMMKPEHLVALTPEHLAALTPAKIAAITKSPGNQLRFDQVNALNAEQISSLNPQVITGLNAAEVATLSDAQLLSITPLQIAAIRPNNLGALQSEQISIMSAQQIQALSPSQFASLSPIQISSFTAAQISTLGQSHLLSLNEVQRAALLPEQINSLSTPQREALGLTSEAQRMVSNFNLDEFVKTTSPSDAISPVAKQPVPLSGGRSSKLPPGSGTKPLSPNLTRSAPISKFEGKGSNKDDNKGKKLD